MKPPKAIYAGTFDPFTNGHLDIVTRARSYFLELTILVANNEGKKNRKTTLLTAQERVDLISKVVKPFRNVKVDQWDGLVVDYARKHSASVLVRGLRAASDFEYEFMMASMNRELRGNIETFFMATGQNLYFLSSSMIKELLSFGGDVSPYLPRQVVAYLNKKKE